MGLKDPGRLLMDKETREDCRGLHSSWLVLYTILHLCSACLGQLRIRLLITFEFTEQITTTADWRSSSTNNSQPLSPIHLLTQLPTNTLDNLDVVTHARYCKHYSPSITHHLLFLHVFFIHWNVTRENLELFGPKILLIGAHSWPQSKATDSGTHHLSRKVRKSYSLKVIRWI